MKKVTAFQADDGSVHQRPEAAALADKKHALKEWASKRGICSGGTWDAEMVIEAILEDELVLRKILVK